MIHPSKARRRWVLTAVLLTATVGLGGCSYVPEWADPVTWYDRASGGASPPPDMQAQKSDVETAGKPRFPNLSEVPARPEGAASNEARAATVEGLVADRENARYTDETLRAAEAETEAVAPQPVEKAPPPVEAPGKAEEPRPAPPKEAAPPVRSAAPPPLPPAAVPASPTPMIAAMTRQRRMGKTGPAPSLVDTPSRSTPAYEPPPPLRSVEAPLPPPVVPPAPIVPPAPRTAKPDAGPPPPQQLPATVVPPATLRAPPPPLAPTTQPSYPATAAPTAPAAGGDLLNQTFAARLKDSAATVSTAPASEDYTMPSATLGSSYAVAAATSPSAAAGNAPSAGTTVTGLLPPVGPPRRLAVIKFAHGSARIPRQAYALIREAAARQKAERGVLRVVGHSSSRTRDLPVERHKMVNFSISLKRAQAVADALIRKGADPAKVLIEAKGDSEPVYFEAMPRGEAENRRVEIFLER